MFSRIKDIFGSAPSQSMPALPAGQRVYAVGDVHGRADLFAALAEAIEADHARRDESASLVILLGDLVDRGPDSASVLRLAREWQAQRPLRALMGNHEEMFLAALRKPSVMRPFLRFGGRETLLSYPIDPAAYTRAEIEEVMELAQAAIPPADLDFVASFEDQVTIGDYHFVHAGVRPGVALDAQKIGDLRWIREPFLDHTEDFGAVVVHGHTITAKPDFRANRIGIDTGAYNSGRLTALGLEGTTRWLLTAAASDGAVRVTTGD